MSFNCRIETRQGLHANYSELSLLVFSSFSAKGKTRRLKVHLEDWDSKRLRWGSGFLKMVGNKREAGKERVADAPFHSQLLRVVVLIMMFLEMANEYYKPASDDLGSTCTHHQSFSSNKKDTVRVRVCAMCNVLCL